MSTVVMRHPSLPPEQEIEVDEQAVPHHANAGWIPVPAEELEARAQAAAKEAARAAAAEKAAAEPQAAETESAETESAPARRRAMSKKEGA
ncbi:MAG TPA: hypothetical protein VI172_09730 [Candidatus Dormibacteraeota bacterium]